MSKDRIVIPGIPTDAARVIIDRIRQNEDRLALLERTSGRPGIVSSDTAAVVGEFLNIAGRSDELISIILPEPTQARRNARVTLAFRNEHDVRIVAVNGTVNGAPFVLNNLPGTYDAICDGLGGWAVQVGVTEEGVIGTPGVPSPTDDAQYVIGAAHAGLPNGAVAADSTEVDVTVTPGGTATWILNAASVVLSKLANLAGLSVLGRAANSAGVMAAITATAANQRLVSNTAGTSLAWVSVLSEQYDDTVVGIQDPYLLPAGFRPGDSLVWVITGDVTIRAIRLSDNSVPPDGFWFSLALRDQSGGAAPGHSIIIEDTGAARVDGAPRPPGQIQGTSPGPSYIMQSEEEGCLLVIRAGNWRLIGGTAAQAIAGDIVVPAGNGGTRTAAIGTGVIVNADVNASAAIAQTKLGATTGFSVKASGASATTSAEPIVTYSASANMSAERVTTSSTSVTVSTSVANQIEFQRAALTGAVTAPANSNTTAIAAGVIVNADVNAAAAIAISKLENVGANVAIGTTTSGTVPTAIAVATDTAMARIGEGATNTGYGAQSRDDMMRWLNSSPNVRVFDEEFQGNLVHHIGGESRFSIVSGLAGIALSTLSNSTGEWTGALNLSSGAGNGTTRSTYTLGANESAFNFHWESLRYFSCVFRLRLATTANTHWAIGLVGPFSGYGAVTADVLAGTSEGIFVTGVTSSSANIHVGRRTASATAKTDTGVAVADNRFQYEFFRTAAGVDYHYLNGSLIRTDASGIAPASTACTFFFSMVGSTTAERAIELDHVKVIMQSSNRFT
jgi:hypothetical protein